jgi:hypothetical protein
MTYISRAILGLALLGSLLAVVPSTSLAAPSCSGRVVCAHTLGIALTRPAGWQRIPGPKVAPHEIDLVLPGSGLSYNLRLVIRAAGVGSLSGSQAARLIAGKLIAAERATGVTQTTAWYAGSPAVVLHGLPGSPGPAINIVLAHGNHVYLIIVPGRQMAADQRVALRSLRFIPRTGRFPGDVSG